MPRKRSTATGRTFVGIAGWTSYSPSKGAASSRTCVIDPAADRPAGRDVYVYFDNDAKVHAPFDAIRLAERLKSA